MTKNTPIELFLTPNTQIRREIPPDTQVFKTLLILNNQPLLIRQMQQTNKTITRRYVSHCLFRIHRLQVIDHRCKLKSLIRGFRSFSRCR